MHKACLLPLAILLSCSGAGQVREGEKYVSEFGGFTCGPFSLPTKSQAAFGPKGGTVRFIDDVAMIRVDVVQIEPPLDKATLQANVERVHQVYLKQSTLPLVKGGVSDATLIGERLANINGMAVYQSAIRLPGASNGVSGDGKRLDGIRGQAQFTNGQFMFTVSETIVAWPDKTNAEQLDLALHNAEMAFKQCAFPQ